MDWFFINPVLEGYISYADLKNGNLTLYDIYILNRVISYKNEKIDMARRNALLKQVTDNKRPKA